MPAHRPPNNSREVTVMKMCSTPVVVDRGFPYAAVVILAMCYLINNYTLVNVFPYGGLMTKHLLALETTNDSGYYAGYIASAFTFGRFVSAYGLGLLSDKIGRKPVIILGLLSNAALSMAFGLATSFRWAVAIRFLLGLTNGIVAATRASVREVCGRRHVVMGMTYFAGLSGIALVVGTGIGGVLAEPAQHYPNIFSSKGFFARYPFLLPNLVGAGLALAITPFVVFCLPETKAFTKVPLDEDARSEGTKVGAIETGAGDGCKLSKNDDVHWDGRKRPVDGLCRRNGLLASPVVISVLCLACMSQLILIGYDEVYPLWTLSTVEVGGLAWGSREIGKVFLVTGVILAPLQLVAFPAIIGAIGLTKWQRVGCVLGLFGFLLSSNNRLLSWDNSSLFASCVSSVVLVYSASATIDIAHTVAATNIAPPLQRGTLSGLFNTAEGLGRCIGPAGFATLYAFSVSPSADALAVVNCHFVFLLFAFIMLVITIVGWVMLTPTILEKVVPDEEVDAAPFVFTAEDAGKIQQ